MYADGAGLHDTRLPPRTQDRAILFSTPGTLRGFSHSGMDTTTGMVQKCMGIVS